MLLTKQQLLKNVHSTMLQYSVCYIRQHDILKKATPENRSCLHNCTLLGQKGLVKPLLEPQ